MLFSELKGGLHMAIVTADDARARSRDLDVPTHDSGMAHRLFLSTRWESRARDGDGRILGLAAVSSCPYRWRLCETDRLVPGKLGAHRRDGRPMGGGSRNFAANADGGAFHIWRQDILRARRSKLHPVRPRRKASRSRRMGDR